MSRGNTRQVLARMTFIHDQLNHGRPVTAAKVARALEVSPKTIQRDFDFMRDRLLLPLTYVPERQTFVYFQPVTRPLFGEWKEAA